MWIGILGFTAFIWLRLLNDDDKILATYAQLQVLRKFYIL